MRVLVLILSFLLIPVAGAISDLSVYSKGSYESQLNAPILVAVSYTHLTLPTIPGV